MALFTRRDREHFALIACALALGACGGDDDPLFAGTTATSGQGGGGASTTGTGAASSSGGSAGSSQGGAGGSSQGGASAGGGGAGTGGMATCPGTAPGCVVDWAGQFGAQAAVDGQGQAARFDFIAGITTAGGFVYVTDNHAIRRIDLGTADVVTWAGATGQPAHVDASGTAARFDSPSGIATDGTRLWVADAGNFVVREIDIATGQVTTIAGAVGVPGSTDGSGAATFQDMRDLAWDGTSLYIVQAGTKPLLRAVDPPSGFVITLAGLAGMPGFADGSGPLALFDAPRFVEVISVNEVYVGDTENHRPRHVGVIGTVGQVTSPYGTGPLGGYQDGTGTAAQFRRLRGVAFDGGNRLLIGDSDNFCIRAIDLTTDAVTTIAGMANVQTHAVGSGLAAGFDKPNDVHFDASTADLFISEGAVLRRMYAP